MSHCLPLKSRFSPDGTMMRLHAHSDDRLSLAKIFPIFGSHFSIFLPQSAFPHQLSASFPSSAFSFISDLSCSSYSHLIFFIPHFWMNRCFLPSRSFSCHTTHKNDSSGLKPQHWGLNVLVCHPSVFSWSSTC